MTLFVGQFNRFRYDMKGRSIHHKFCSNSSYVLVLLSNTSLNVLVCSTCAFQTLKIIITLYWTLLMETLTKGMTLNLQTFHNQKLWNFVLRYQICPLRYDISVLLNQSKVNSICPPSTAIKSILFAATKSFRPKFFCIKWK